ncbi:helix-turn-helix domain-containing protein [Paenibacillus xylaniclasticus]|uniref:helix-turn-helix domain-containing protein n=1 Tax=Paenibacillus xylaniclasticus TaxID=588083 RepID=UPI000FDBE7C0|nr:MULTISPECIES: helix-turn-helix transcriptional regulator [Paenibacillus]GFN32522.1 hypothetical protein PCURB6_27820 [Paenibacillus curdlanolyticus]
MDSFGVRLKHLRNLNGLTQAQLGEFLYADNSTISKWESGASEPNLEQLVSIATKLNVSIDWLLLADEAKLPRLIDSEIEILISKLSAEDYEMVVHLVRRLHQ